MPTTFYATRDNVSTTTTGYAAGSGSLALAAGTGAAFGTAFPVLASTFLADGTPCGVYSAAGRAGDTLTGLTLVSGTDATLPPGATVAVRWTAEHVAQITAAVNALEAGRPYSVLDHGLDNTGAVDNIVPLQNLINTVNAAGGGVILFPPGTYGVKPGPTTQVNLLSNVRLQGSPGAVIRVLSTSGDYNTIFGQASASTPITGVTVDGLWFDQNPAGNTGSNIQANSATAGAVVVSLGNAPSVRITDCVFDPCCGVNTVVVAGNTVDALVRGNRFHFVRGASATEYDNSAVYMNCPSHRVLGNYFDADVSQHARGAIESHNGQSVVSGNVTDGYQTLCNVVTAGGASDPRDNTDVTVSGNTCSRANYAVQLWSLTGHTLRNVTVTGNTVSVSQVEHGEVNCCGVECVYDSGGTLDGDFSNIVIADNAVSFEPDANRSLSRTGAALAPASSWAIGLAPRGNLKNVLVTGNVVRNAPVAGVVLGQSVGTSSRVKIKDNLFVDSGQNAGVTQGYRTAVHLQGALTDVECDANSVYDTGTTAPNGYQSLVYQPSSAAAVSFRNNRIHALSATGLTTNVDQTKPLDLGSVLEYGTPDTTTNYERVVGRWASTYGTGQPTYGLFTDLLGTGLNRPMMVGSGVPGSGNTSVYTKWYGRGLPFVESHVAAMNIDGVSGAYFAWTGTIQGSAVTPRKCSVQPTITQTGTAGYTLLEVNPTEVTTGSGPKTLLWLGANGVKKAGVDNAGNVTAASFAGDGSQLTGVNAGTFSAQNKDAATLPAGCPVAVHSSGTGVVGASAADGTRPAVGLLRAATAVGFAGAVQFTGPFALADWTAVTGTAALAAHAVYYLGTTPGTLTATPPATPGQSAQRAGVAVAPDTLDLQFGRPILL